MKLINTFKRAFMCNDCKATEGVCLWQTDVPTFRYLELCYDCAFLKHGEGRNIIIEVAPAKGA